MRARPTPRKSVARRNGRTAMGFAVVLLTSLFVMNSVSRVQAADPGDVTLISINAMPMGFNTWFVDGFVQAIDLSAVTVTLGATAGPMSTIQPNPYGYFSFEVTGTPDEIVTAYADDGSHTSSREVKLLGFF